MTRSSRPYAFALLLGLFTVACSSATPARSAKDVEDEWVRKAWANPNEPAPAPRAYAPAVVEAPADAPEETAPETTTTTTEPEEPARPQS
jgi:hypothetical protein